MPRFKPTDATPGIPQPPSWEPGVVEVQFREDAPPQINSPADADMMPLNRLQQYHQLREAATAWISPTRTTPLMVAPSCLTRQLRLARDGRVGARRSSGHRPGDGRVRLRGDPLANPGEQRTRNRPLGQFVGEGHRLGPHRRQRWQTQGNNPRGPDEPGLGQLRAGTVGERRDNDRHSERDCGLHGRGQPQRRARRRGQPHPGYGLHPGGGPRHTTPRRTGARGSATSGPGSRSRRPATSRTI
jgi:hypothetical protein